MSSALRILVVDDDRENADSLSELFEMEGHLVDVAYCGEEAIARQMECDYDIAFIDVVMPGLNGVESFLEIRRLKPSARVYMMTAYSVEQLLRQAIDNGALGVMTKPLDPECVLRHVEELAPHGIAVLSDADPSAGQTVKSCIDGRGHRCEVAATADAALSAVERESLDVLVLDLEAPLVEGLGVYTKLRKSNRALPTVLVTPWGSDEDRKFDNVGEMTVTGILNKPFDPGLLLEKLATFAA